MFGDGAGMQETFQVRYPQERLRMKAFSKPITGICFTPGNTITLSAHDTQVKIFEMHGDGKRELNSFVPFRYCVSCVAATPADTETQMLAVAARNCVKLYRFETLDSRGGLYAHETSVTDVKFSWSGKARLLVATVSNDKTLKVWQQAGPREWSVVCNLEGHSDAIRSLAWAPDDSSILTGSVDGTVKVWALQEQEEQEPAQEVSEQSLARNADSRPRARAKLGGNDTHGKVEMQKKKKSKVFKLLATFDGHGDTVTNVRFHPQGSLAITCSRDKEVRVYDTRVPFRSTEPATHSQPVSLVTAAKGVDKEGRQLIGSLDTAGFLKIWHVNQGEPLLVCAVDVQHTMTVTGIAFTNSVRYLISASKDGSIKRWDMARLAQQRFSV
jgi:WD40 repeat protein